jgi:5-oxoprolinase (ATP-hydrolysing)
MSDVNEFWIDVGGTFTDCFLRQPGGTLRRHKLLSTGETTGTAATGSNCRQIIDPARSSDPARFWEGYQLRLLDRHGQVLASGRVADFDRESGTLRLEADLTASPEIGQPYALVSDEEAPLVAIRYLLGLPRAAAIRPVHVRLGTTRGTNALLTRRGARTAFVTTRGFADVLHIGYQNRPRLFDLDIVKPEPLFSAVAEIDQRLAADGSVLQSPDERQVRSELARLQGLQINSLAICLLHACSMPAHEQLIADIAREMGFSEISVSHRVASLVKMVARGDTTVVDAYLNPVLRSYVAALRRALPGSQLRLVTSAGGLVAADAFTGKDSILSGPAGGVVGYAHAARAAGFTRAIGFDMGGTSTDVSRYDGRYELEYETEKAGVRVVAPMLAIETVAAGGGSICRYDGVKFIVGPDSAGAEPGPAAYGRGGPLTVTDLNFFLGRIPADHFPLALDRPAVESRLRELAAEVTAATARDYSLTRLAEDLLRVANATMIKAIRSISVAKGFDPRDYALVAFGGAGGQHACAIAEELGMPAILSHPDAGLLSAYGIGMAELERHAAAGIYRPLGTTTLDEASHICDQLAGELVNELSVDGADRQHVHVERQLELRYQGVDASLIVNLATVAECEAAFLAAHRRLYGYVHAGRPLEIVAVRVTARAKSNEDAARSVRVSSRPARARHHAQTWFGGELHHVPIFDRADLQAGDQIPGPAVVCEATSTLVVDPLWQAEVLSQGELLVTRKVGTVRNSPSSGDSTADSATADPALLEIFNNQLAGIAEQMGHTLRASAGSVNVKERLDFSCALFTAAGHLVVNAPHIPVHLGAMGETVRRILADNPSLQPGDVLVTNDPFRGGSHLPDITVVTPVHEPVSGQLVFFTASRAHHSEIGGTAPGSAPPFSRSLAEEGVLIRNFKLLDAGRPRWDELRALLTAPPYPSRDPAANLADLAAQVAANQLGSRELLALAERISLPVVLDYMRHIQAAAERKTRLALARIPDGAYRWADQMDDGTPVAVAITIHGDQARIDFSGTGPVSPGNLNANPAIVTAAVMYVLRCLLAEDIPLNQGVLTPVEIILPAGLLNPPAHDDPARCAAMVGGNVETSQRVVDVLLGALGLAAASQGTMNNFIFGDETFGYYETICGGAGATPNAAGADAVHTHMTNTRLTDPEIFERRYPVRLREFSIRRGSGGQGHHRGGDGVVRRVEFLRSLSVSLLTQRRGPAPPFGLAGGKPGALGRNTRIHADGRLENLGARAQFTAAAGDALTIETPGGGGWGVPQELDSTEINISARMTDSP